MLHVFDIAFEKGTSITDKVTYLQSVAHHQTFSEKDVNSMQKVILKCKILLEDSSTRHVGLLLLQTIVSQSSSEVFLQQAYPWMQLLIKLLHSSDTCKHKELSCIILTQIVKKLPQHPVLKQNVKETLSKSLLSALLEISPDDEWVLEATQCLASVMEEFPGSCVQYKVDLENFLLRQLDSFLFKDLEPVARCFSLLPTCINNNQKMHSVDWSAQFKLMLFSIKSVFKYLNDGDMEGLQGTMFCKNILPPDPEEPYSEMLRQTRRFQAVSWCLAKMLSSKYECKVKIPVEDLLSFICDVLYVSYETLLSKKTNDALVFASVLPAIKCSVLAILESLILSYPHIFIVHGATIMKVILQLLKATSIEDNSSGEARWRFLRSRTLKVFRTFIDLLGCNSSVDYYIQKLIPHLLKDIKPSTSPVTVILSQKTKTPFQDEINNPDTDKDLKVEANRTTCCEALQALSSLIYGASAFIPPDIDKETQDTVVSALLQIQQNPSSPTFPYNIDTNRFELYNLLLCLVVNYKSLELNPLQISLSIFKAGCQDHCIEVSRLCQKAVAMCNTIIHPQRSSVHVPIKEPSKPKFRIAEVSSLRNKADFNWQMNGNLVQNNEQQFLKEDISLQAQSDAENPVIVHIPASSEYSDRGDCNDDDDDDQPMPSQDENSEDASNEESVEEEEEVDEEEEEYDEFADADEKTVYKNHHSVPKINFTSVTSGSVTLEDGLVHQQSISENELKVHPAEDEMNKSTVDNQVILVKENGICKSESEDGYVLENMKVENHREESLKRKSTKSSSDNDDDDPTTLSRKRKLSATSEEAESNDVDVFSMMQDFELCSPDGNSCS